MPEAITKDMTIGEVVEKHPHAASVMLSYGLHCVGCHVNMMETVEQGARGHGMSDEMIQKMMEDLNKELNKEPVKENEPIIKLTQRAANQARKLMAQDNKEGYGLRVGVVPGGCSGFNYLLDFENERKEGDHTFEQQGLTIYVNEDSVQHVRDLELDYVETLQEQGFKFENPNAVSTCGCGTSFGV